jgi:hypothetical protein
MSPSKSPKQYPPKITSKSTKDLRNRIVSITSDSGENLNVDEGFTPVMDEGHSEDNQARINTMPINKPF